MATSTANPTTSLPAGSTNIQGLAPWASGYITDYLGKGQALADTDYQVYQGPMTAGPSELQTKAFSGIGSLTVPDQFSKASGILSDVASRAKSASYSPTTFTSAYDAPDAYQALDVGSMYNAPAPYAATTFENLYKAPDEYAVSDFSKFNFEKPEDYQAVARSLTDAGVAQRYMNPYVQQALDPTLREIQRQSAINIQPQLAKLTAAGAFGGSREALLRGEAQRNLLDQIAKTTGEGYATAYDKAATQFNAEEARRVQEAQYAATQGMNFAELKSKFGLEAAKAAEQSKQFSAQQKATAAELMAKYGLSAQQATEQARQFSYEQAMSNARNMAQFGLEGKRISEQSRQFGAQQEREIAAEKARQEFEAQKASELSRQFGADYGLKGLQQQTAAAQGLGSLGAQQQAAAAQNAQLALNAGEAQRAIEQQALAADYAEFIRQQEFPYKQLQFQRDLISGLPISSVSNSPANLSGLAQLITAAGGVDQLLKDTGSGSLTDLLNNLFGGNVEAPSTPSTPSVPDTNYAGAP